MGGPNLEVFKFGMYIMFPIGIMYYFGTNLDSRFAVPDFWPKEGETHTIPFERDEITAELERLKQRRLAARARRLAMEGATEGVDVRRMDEMGRSENMQIAQAEKTQDAAKKGIMSWFR